MKLFLSTSFSHKIDYDTGEVLPEFRREIEQMLAAVRAAGHEVFAAVEREGWKLSDEPPEACAEFDIKQLDEADALLAILHDRASAGVQWEMGYADGLGKKVYVVQEDEDSMEYWNRALEGMGRITRLPYSQADITEFAEAVKTLV
jgi:nucleoside 2-deoxyribosyltransferase